MKRDQHTEREFCSSIIATQEVVNGRLVCDTERMLNHYNTRKRAEGVVPRTWTLDQLHFAHEVCFPETFRIIVQKYLAHVEGKSEPVARAEAVVHMHDMKRAGGLYGWLRHYSRASLEDKVMLRFVDSVIAELVGGYGSVPETKEDPVEDALAAARK